MSFLTTVVLLLFLTIPEGISVGDHGVILRCRCITKEKKPIGRYIGQVELYLASSHCNEIEIIASLKKSGQKVCLDPNAPWVRKVLARKLAEQAS